MKNILPKSFLVALVIFAFSLNSVLAASLGLTKIGALDVGSKKISGQWWYTSTNPTLYGTAAADATVNVKIDDTESSTMSDASGNWQLYSDKLTNGNHNVMISSSGESFSFSLTIGQGVPEGTASGTTGKGGSMVPTTGGSNLIVYIAASAILLLGGGALLINRKTRA